MDNAFERARAAYGTGAYDDATLEFLFPELRGSEDERIRKRIVEILDSLPVAIGMARRKRMTASPTSKSRKIPNGLPRKMKWAYYTSYATSAIKSPTRTTRNSLVFIKT